MQTPLCCCGHGRAIYRSWHEHIFTIYLRAALKTTTKNRSKLDTWIKFLCQISLHTSLSLRWSTSLVFSLEILPVDILCESALIFSAQGELCPATKGSTDLQHLEDAYLGFPGQACSLLPTVTYLLLFHSDNSTAILCDVH